MKSPAKHIEPESRSPLVPYYEDESCVIYCGDCREVMEGIADVTPMAGVEVRDALRTKIEEKFMGASGIFDAFCENALKKNQA